MARKVDFIGWINRQKETLKLCVRIGDLWFIQNHDSNTHLEMILMDEKVM